MKLKKIQSIEMNISLLLLEFIVVVVVFVVFVIIDNTQSHIQCARSLCMCKWMHFMEFSNWMNIYHHTVSSSGIHWTRVHGRIRLLKRFLKFRFRQRNLFDTLDAKISQSEWFDQIGHIVPRQHSGSFQRWQTGGWIAFYSRFQFQPTERGN